MGSGGADRRDSASTKLGIDLVVCFIGFASFIVIFIGLFVLLPSLAFVGTYILCVRILCGLVLLGMAAIVYGTSQIVAQRRSIPLFACAVVGTVGFIGVPAFMVAGLEWQAVVSLAFAALGVAALGALWFMQLCHIRGSGLMLFITLGTLVGVCLCLGMWFMEALACQVAVALFALVSFGCVCVLARMRPKTFAGVVKNRDSDKRSKIQASSAIMLGSTFFEFGFVVGMTTITDVIVPCFIGGILAASMLVLDTMADRVITERSLAPLMPPLLVFAFMFMLAFGDVAKLIALCIITIVFSIYLAFGLVALVEHVRICDLAPLRTYGKARCIDYAGFVLGLACGFAVQGLSARYASFLVLAIAAAICMLALISHKPRFPEAGMERDQGMAEKDARMIWRQRCQAVGERYKLSDRQQEVLFLMAQGRNAKYIESALVISLSTVQTHIRNIYRKLGVHSRQELLDLIEETKLYGED